MWWARAVREGSMSGSRCSPGTLDELTCAGSTLKMGVSSESPQSLNCWSCG